MNTTPAAETATAETPSPTWRTVFDACVGDREVATFFDPKTGWDDCAAFLKERIAARVATGQRIKSDYIVSPRGVWGTRYGYAK